MNLQPPQNTLRWIRAALLIGLITANLLAVRPLPTQAQSGSSETPSQILTSLPDTPQPLIEPTGGENSPTPGESAPLAAETPTPSLQPTAEAVSSETPTPEPEFTLEPSPTPLLTETATPELADASKLAWSLLLSVPVPAAEVQAMGGAGETGARLLATLDEKVQALGARVSLQQAQTLAAGPAYQVEIEGNNSADELRQMIYAGLGADFDFLGGPVQLSLAAEVRQGQEVEVLLESRPGTGYTWEIVSVRPAILELAGSPQTQSKSSGPGAPARQTMRLRATGNGAVTLQLVYQRPFEAGAAATRILSLQTANMPAALDLSSPLTLPTPSLGEAQAATDSAESAPLVGLPASFDWRSAGKLTPIRNQGACGGCWAFGTVGVMESALLIQSNTLTDLSEQYLISCNNNGWGCSGGWWAHDLHTNTGGKNGNPPGAVLENQKPYTATNGSCSAVYNHPYRLSDWRYIATPNSIPSVDQIKSAIYNHGPVAAAVCSIGFAAYTGGIYSQDSTACSGGVDHAVILVGWNDADQTWILRNSWGSSWGENGYMRIRWNTSNVGLGATYVVYNAPPPVPAPSNDDFDSAISIANPGGIAKFQEVKDVSGANLSSDDPFFPFATPRQGHRTVWYRFSTYTGGTLLARTTGSSYDTILGVYTGQRGALKRVAWNDNISSTVRQSRVSFTAKPATTYFIEVASKSAGAGSLAFSLTFTPPKTAFNLIGSAKVLADNGKGYRYSERRDVYTATVSSGDPQFPLSSGATRGYRTIWYKFTPLTNGVLSVNTQGSNFDTLLGVWRSPSANPSLVSWNDDGGGGGASALSVRLAGRTAYWIEVADKQPGNPSSHLAFALQFTPDTPVGAGDYDDGNDAIVYLGNWGRSSVSGAYENGLSISGSNGDIAALTFTGRRVRLRFSRLPDGGYVSIYIDGRLVTTLRQYAAAQRDQQTWTSPLYKSGRHTVRFVHKSGAKINLDALVVVP